jgi:hypothetical protein
LNAQPRPDASGILLGDIHGPREQLGCDGQKSSADACVDLADERHSSGSQDQSTDLVSDMPTDLSITAAENIHRSGPGSTGDISAGPMDII